MESNFYTYEDIDLHYYKYGNGAKSLLCFHGYGQSATVFNSLAKRLSSRYTIYAFDLFYHGHSKWPDCEKALSPMLLSELIKSWLIHECIDRINLCGYSLGGKVALSLVELLDKKIEKILLIAPDGIKTNFWYNMATYPYWARRIFRYTIHHPNVFYQSVSLMERFHILDKGVVRFTKFQMSNVPKRKKVYCTWIVYRKIKPEIEKLAHRINTSGIQLTIYLGKYDRIITKKSTIPLISQVDHYELFVLNTGHNSLIEDVASEEKLTF